MSKYFWLFWHSSSTSDRGFTNPTLKLISPQNSLLYTGANNTEVPQSHVGSWYVIEIHPSIPTSSSDKALNHILKSASLPGQILFGLIFPPEVIKIIINQSPDWHSQMLPYVVVCVSSVKTSDFQQTGRLRGCAINFLELSDCFL